MENNDVGGKDVEETDESTLKGVNSDDCGDLKTNDSASGGLLELSTPNGLENCGLCVEVSEGELFRPFGNICSEVEGSNAAAGFFIEFTAGGELPFEIFLIVMDCKFWRRSPTETAEMLFCCII